MTRSINIRKLFYLIFIFGVLNFSFGRQNKFFWDGNDWNRISKSVKYDHDLNYKVKSAYLLGVLDGRLFSYLKVWNIDQQLADKTFSETVDYLTIRELIKNIDYFYQDPLNAYIPIPSAILIANMYAERVPIQNIELYIESTRRWINDLILDLDTLNYTKLLEEKWLKHKKKHTNQFE
tara:strand:+ start:520 stop:1053 length:534 start_codon:yes stop_codon:yes gene_type:complete